MSNYINNTNNNIIYLTLLYFLNVRVILQMTLLQIKNQGLYRVKLIFSITVYIYNYILFLLFKIQSKLYNIALMLWHIKTYTTIYSYFYYHVIHT